LVKEAGEGEGVKLLGVKTRKKVPGDHGTGAKRNRDLGQAAGCGGGSLTIGGGEVGLLAGPLQRMVVDHQ